MPERNVDASRRVFVFLAGGAFCSNPLLSIGKALAAPVLRRSILAPLPCCGWVGSSPMSALRCSWWGLPGLCYASHILLWRWEHSAYVLLSQ